MMIFFYLLIFSLFIFILFNFLIFFEFLLRFNTRYFFGWACLLYNGYCLNLQYMGNCINHILTWVRSFNAVYKISGKKLRQLKNIAEGGYGFVSLVQDV